MGDLLLAKSRIRILALVFTIALALLSLQLFRVQIIEAANYNTFSKLIYDIFLFFVQDVKDSNYTFEAYKSWYIKTKELEMFWDGRDSYLILWDISTGDRKTLKIENSDITNFKLIEEYLEIISKN